MLQHWEACPDTAAGCVERPYPSQIAVSAILVTGMEASDILCVLQETICTCSQKSNDVPTCIIQLDGRLATSMLHAQGQRLCRMKSGAISLPGVAEFEDTKKPLKSLPVKSHGTCKTRVTIASSSDSCASAQTFRR